MAAQQLSLPVPFDVLTLCESMARQRRRPVRLMPTLVGLGSLCGAWIAGQSEDYIFYERDTSPLHRDHIVLHELGHILCGHSGSLVSADQYARLLMPDLDPALIRSMLGRSGYTSRQEREAELFAELIWERVRRAERRQHPPEANEVLDRMQSTFGEVRDR
jgi:hypothetical protein